MAGWGVLVPVGAIVGGGAFFLPYVRVFRVFGVGLTVAGPRIGGALWLVPAAAAVVLLAYAGVFGRRGWLRRAIEIAGALFGLLVCFGVVLRLHHRTGLLFVHFSAATFGVRPAIGWWLSLVGFFLALAGALLRRPAR